MCLGLSWIWLVGVTLDMSGIILGSGSWSCFGCVWDYPGIWLVKFTLEVSGVVLKSDSGIYPGCVCILDLVSGN